MHTPTPYRLAAFAAVLAIVFAGAAVAGGAIDPDREDPPAAHAGGGGHSGEADPVRGLAVAEDGLRLVLADGELRRGRTERVALKVVDERGAAVRDFDLAHERRMHVIVVRRDLSGFQHLHPRMAVDGTWSVPVRLPEAGSYRLFADFTRHGEAHTLASDLRVDGEAALRDLPASRSTARTDDGYDVRLDAAGSELRFTITRDGEPVQAEPYLGAGGHLVALREGDLAFLHVHPTGEGTSFETTFPTPGRYRLFLQFKHAGSVHTAAFTREVG